MRLSREACGAVEGATGEPVLGDGAKFGGLIGLPGIEKGTGVVTAPFAVFNMPSATDQTATSQE